LNRREFGAAVVGLASMRWATGLGRSAQPAGDGRVAFDTLTFDHPDVDGRAALRAGMSGALVDLKAFPRVKSVARAELQLWDRAAAAPGASVFIVRGPGDFDRARDAGRFAVVLDSQNAAILEEPGDTEEQRFETLREFFGLGLRALQLTYNDRNSIGGGYWEDTEVPLSLYGRHLLAEMNKLGVLIDLSHCCEMTTLDAIRHSKRPVAVTHAGCRALFDNQRNKSDAVIRALAERGGYFGVYNMTLWMTEAQTSSVETIVDHIDHAVKVGGMDLVGFGSDHPIFGESGTKSFWVTDMAGWAADNTALGRKVGGPPKGHVFATDLNGADRMQRIAGELRRRRYREGDIEKVLGRNFVRMFGAACG
jgi:membrane dipeptidase